MATRRAKTTTPRGATKRTSPPAAKGQSAARASSSGSELHKQSSATLNAVGEIATTSGVKTIIYVHGIGNKPIASVLKCQWDTALFGTSLGDQTRMAYWVNRENYPTPLAGTCASGDTVKGGAGEISTDALRTMDAGGTDPVRVEIEALTSKASQRKTLASIAAKLETKSAAADALSALDVHAEVLPLPPFLRRFITKELTRLFLRDVNDFLFHKDRRDQMRKSLLDRLNAGGGPFVVVAHSQGTMIAYDVLRELAKDQYDVRLFVTIGSPLGLQEVQDMFHQWSGETTLRIPDCVSRWVNVADRLDPVAFDNDLSDDFTGAFKIENHADLNLNPDSPSHPHSATGYLSTEFVRTPVRDAVGNGFGQEVGKFVIARDLANQMEDAFAEQRHDVLIELKAPDGTEEVSTRADLEKALRKMVAGHEDAAKIDPLRRYIAAKLTRSEVETLRTKFGQIAIERVWRDAPKAALIAESSQTLQVRPANDAYHAVGQNIHWAILDTGLAVDHPHFLQHANLAAQFDCRKTGPIAAVPLKTSTDGHGHGTHVAGIIAGALKPLKKVDGKRVGIDMRGMAPEAKLHVYKVLDDAGGGQDSWIIKALDHIAQTNESSSELVIHGVNLSLGGPFDPSVFGCGHTPLCEELRRLWRQGVVVVLAAGNDGYAILQSSHGDLAANLDLSIGDPANLDEALAVGSVHKTAPHTYGVSYFSSRGPTADGRKKPDVVAPGEKIASACHSFSEKPAGTYKYENLYVEMSGTSMAAPHISGMVAAFLSLRREFIGYPDRVKEMLMASCTDLRRDEYIQGAGLPNLIKMLALN
jgi:Subtilase family